MLIHEKKIISISINSFNLNLKKKTIFYTLQTDILQRPHKCSTNNVDAEVSLPHSISPLSFTIVHLCSSCSTSMQSTKSANASECPDLAPPVEVVPHCWTVWMPNLSAVSVILSGWRLYEAVVYEEVRRGSGENMSRRMAVVAPTETLLLLLLLAVLIVGLE